MESEIFSSAKIGAKTSPIYVVPDFEHMLSLAPYRISLKLRMKMIKSSNNQQENVSMASYTPKRPIDKFINSYHLLPLLCSHLVVFTSSSMVEVTFLFARKELPFQKLAWEHWVSCQSTEWPGLGHLWREHD